MKRFLLILALLLPFVTANDVFGDQEMDGITMRQITKEDGALYSWLEHGQLFVRDNGRGKKVSYFYRSSDGHSGEISDGKVFSAMIREQIDADHTAEAFLDSELPRVIFSFLGSVRASVIDQDYINYYKSLPNYAWRGATALQVYQSSDVLEKYVYKKPHIERGQWSAEFYALLANGSVEKWNLDGEIDPFSIDALKRIEVEKKGTVLCPLEVER